VQGANEIVRGRGGVIPAIRREFPGANAGGVAAVFSVPAINIPQRPGPSEILALVPGRTRPP